jgi:hypothetical protein
MRKDYPKKPDGSPDVWAIGERLGASALGGFVAGGVLGGGGAGVHAAIQGLRTEAGPAEDTNFPESIETAEGTIGFPEAESTDVTAGDDLKTKMARIISSAPPLIIETERLRRPERARRIAEWEVLKRSAPGRVGLQNAMTALRKKYPHADFTALEEQFTPAEVTEMMESIKYDEVLEPWERVRAYVATEKVLGSDEVLQKNEIDLLSKLFGVEVADALRQRQQARAQKIFHTIVGIANAPIATLASFDISHPLRQGALLAAKHPIVWSKHVGAAYKAMVSEKAAQQLDKDMRTSPDAKVAIRSGLELTEFGEKGKYTQREEAYLSPYIHKIANKFPGWMNFVKWSERAFVVGANRLRMDMFKHRLNQWRDAGYNPTRADLRALASYLNDATGRGTIKGLEKYTTALNPLFFAPRLQISRGKILTGATYLSATPAVRKIVAADLISALIAGMGILSLAAMMGFRVGKDPRSGDFGKIIQGNTRIDIWAGFSPLVRFIAREVVGKTKTATGRIRKADRLGLLGRYLQSKLAPGAGLAVDLLRGETFFGDDLTLEASSLGEQAMQRLVPLFIQDLIDAYRFQGIGSALAVAPMAWHGVGAQTYPQRPGVQAFFEKDRIARETFGQKWEDLGQNTQRILRAAFPSIEQAEMKARAERTKYPFLAEQWEGEKRAGLEVEGGLPENISKEMSRLSVSVKGLSHNIGNNWFLNDKKYEEYKNDLTETLNLVLPKIVNTPQWNQLDDRSKQVLLQEVIDRVKTVVRKNIIEEANVRDLQYIDEALRKGTLRRRKK